ncbi:MAG: hypothetical protein U0174_01670 [Polyangiaceae bacterium]
MMNTSPLGKSRISIHVRASLHALSFSLIVGCGSSDGGAEANLESLFLPAKVYECTPDARTAAAGGESVPERIRVVPTGPKKAIVEIERFLQVDVEENVAGAKVPPSVMLTGRGYKVSIDTSVRGRSANGKTVHPGTFVESDKTIPLSCRPFDDPSWFYEKVRLGARIAGRGPHALPAKVELQSPAFQARIRAANADIEADVRRRGLPLPTENRFFSVQYTHKMTATGKAGFTLWALQTIDPDGPRDATNLLAWTVAFDTSGKEVLRVMAERPE